MKYLLPFWCAVILITGCSRYVCWIRETFNPAIKNNLSDQLEKARAYIASTTIHDTFVTIATIEALLLSPVVFAVYEELYGARWGFEPVEIEERIEQQLENNQDYLSFYILLEPHDGHFNSDNHKLSQWSIFLAIDTMSYQPKEIRSVELEPEYMAIFLRHTSRFMGTYNDDDKYLRFKAKYKVTFDAYDSDKKRLITAQTKEIKLIFKTVRYETYLTWYVNTKDMNYEYIDCPRN